MTPDLNRRDLLASSSLAASAGLAGCTRVHDWVIERFACREPHLAETAARPSNTVTVEGLVEPFGEEPVAWVHDATIDDPSEADRYPALLREIEPADGAHEGADDVEPFPQVAELVVPVHPTGLIDGGSLEVTIESADGSVSCSGLELEVEPLEPAPGATEGVLDEVETHFQEFAALAGYDVDEALEADVRELDPPMNVVAATLRSVAGPDNPNNFRAVLEGTAPILEEFDPAGAVTHQRADPSPQARSLANAVALSSDTDADTREPAPPAGLASTRVLQDTDVDDPEIRELIDALVGESGLLDRVGMAVAEMVVLGEELYGIELDDEEVTPAVLDSLMTVQAGAAEMNRGLSEDLREFTELWMGASSILAAPTVAGGASLAAVGNAVALVGTTLRVFEKGLPSKLDTIELEPDPDGFPEDFEDADTPGSWTAEVEATSQTFRLEWIDDVGGVPLVGPGVKFLSKLPRVGEEVAKLFMELFQWVLEETIDLDVGDPLVIEPVTYAIEDGVTPERDDEEAYFDWELERKGEGDEQPVVFDENDESKYWPEAVGTSYLRVRTERDRFGGEYHERFEEIDVGPIDVEIKRDGESYDQTIHKYYLDLEDDVLKMDLWAHVEKANDPYEVEWELDVITGPSEDVPELTPFQPASGYSEAEFDARGVDFEDWGEADEAVYRIEAESTADGGLRDERDAPPRFDVVQIRITDVPNELVMSSVDCVPTYTTYQFQAQYRNEKIEPFSDLDWRIDGPGSLARDGTFTPRGSGDVTIEFEYDPEDAKAVTEEVSFEVREDCREFSMTPLEPHVFGEKIAMEHTAECVWLEFDEYDEGLARFHIRVPKKEDTEIGDLDRVHFIIVVRREEVNDAMDGDPFSGEWDVYSAKRETWEEATVRYTLNVIRVIYEGVIGREDVETVAVKTAPLPAYIWPCFDDSHNGQLGEIRLQRREVEIDGETTGVYEGHFEGQVKHRGTQSWPGCGRLRLDFFGLRMEDETDCERNGDE